MERVVDGAVGEEVAVGLLCRHHDVDNAIHILLQLGVWLHLEQIGCALNHLEQVGIVEGLPRLELSLHQPRRDGEVTHISRPVATLKGVTDGLVSQGVEPLSPEGILDVHIGERYGRYALSLAANKCQHDKCQ